MAEFEAAIEAQLSGRTVRVNTLVGLDFASGWMGLWPGFGDLATAGKLYRGLGNLGTLPGISQGPAGAVEEVTASIAATEESLAHLSEDAAEAAGREMTISLQFFDVRRFDEGGNWVEWTPLDDPLVLFVGRMGPLTVRREPGGTDGRPTRIVSVTAQNAFINRARPAFAFFTDRDQKSRHPGDNMFVRTSELSEGTVRWPQFS